MVVSAKAPATYTMIVYARTAGSVPDQWTSVIRNLVVTASPMMNVDQPGNHAAVSQPFTISGWALDAAWTGPTGTGVSNVTVWAYRNPGSGAPAEHWGDATLGGHRADVQAAFSLPANFAPSGFTQTVSGKTPGWNLVVVYAFSTVTHSYNQAQIRTIYVDVPTVTLTIDRPGAGTGAVSEAQGTCAAGPSEAQRFCAVTLAHGSIVAMTATPDAGSVFSGWGSGTGGCTVSLLTNRLVVARFDPAPPLETTWYHLDAVGSVRVVSDAAGNVVTRHDYLPFGEDAALPTGDPRRFTGKELDPETNLTYSIARYYRTALGRFTTVDPEHVGGDIFDPQSWNAYAYARNNPLRFVDPAGMEPCQIVLRGADAEAAGVPDGTSVQGECVRPTESWADWFARNFLDPLLFTAPLQAPGLGEENDPLPDRSPDMAIMFAATILPGGGARAAALTPKAARILGTLVKDAGKTLGAVIKARGGGGREIRRTGDLATQTLGAVAEKAAAGNVEAKTAIKIAKDADRLAQKGGGD